jgi:hypothetical protein
VFDRFFYTFSLTAARGGCRASVADLTKPPSWIFEKPELEFLKSLWELGTEEE